MTVRSGDVEALNRATCKVEWSTRVSGIPCGAATVSNSLVFTTTHEGNSNHVESKLLAFNRLTGALVLDLTLPNTTNAPIAIAGNSVTVPAGGPKAPGQRAVSEVVAYTVF